MHPNRERSQSEKGCILYDSICNSKNGKTTETVKKKKWLPGLRDEAGRLGGAHRIF